MQRPEAPERRGLRIADSGIEAGLQRKGNAEQVGLRVNLFARA